MFAIYGDPWNMCAGQVYTHNSSAQSVKYEGCCSEINFALLCSFRQTRSEADCVTPDHVAFDVLS